MTALLYQPVSLWSYNVFNCFGNRSCLHFYSYNCSDKCLSLYLFMHFQSLKEKLNATLYLVCPVFIQLMAIKRGCNLADWYKFIFVTLQYTTTWHPRFSSILDNCFCPPRSCPLQHHCQLITLLHTSDETDSSPTFACCVLHIFSCQPPMLFPGHPW